MNEIYKRNMKRVAEYLARNILKTGKERQPIYTVFAGINGAGKTTLYKALVALGGNETEILDELGTRLNADEILVENGDDWHDEGAQRRAAER